MPDKIDIFKFCKSRYTGYESEIEPCCCRHTWADKRTYSTPRVSMSYNTKISLRHSPSFLEFHPCFESFPWQLQDQNLSSLGMGFVLWTVVCVSQLIDKSFTKVSVFSFLQHEETLVPGWHWKLGNLPGGSCGSVLVFFFFFFLFNRYFDCSLISSLYFDMY